MKINIDNVSYVKIVAKRWFQKSCGNTYHSVSVFACSGEGTAFKHELVGRIPFAYGYEKHYRNTAAKILEIEETGLMELMRQHPEKFLEQVSDVSRKKDM